MPSSSGAARSFSPVPAESVRLGSPKISGAAPRRCATPSMPSTRGASAPSKRAPRVPEKATPPSTRGGRRLYARCSTTTPGSTANKAACGPYGWPPRGQLRGGHNTEAGQRRDHPGNAGKAWRALGAGQTLDGEPRSAVRPQKGARDRLIRLARSHPEWALGFEDESWFSRFERPSLRSWTDVAKPPMRLLQKEPTKDDPEPKALSCYGLYLPELEETWLRFVDGRPVSDITARFLGWCCEKLHRRGKEALLLIWDNAS